MASLQTQLAITSVQFWLGRSLYAVDGGKSVLEPTTFPSTYLHSSFLVRRVHGISSSRSSSSSLASTAAAASTGKLPVLARGDTWASKVVREARGEATGDVGAEDPNLA